MRFQCKIITQRQRKHVFEVLAPNVFAPKHADPLFLSNPRVLIGGKARANLGL